MKETISPFRPTSSFTSRSTPSSGASPFSGELERDFRPYREIVAQSLVEELGTDGERAARIGAAAGTWPLFSDSAEGLRRLRAVARCVAITNSDPEHRPQIEEQLGFALDGW